MKNRILLALIVSATIMGCGNNKGSYTDTITSGYIHICVDDAYKPLIDSEVKVFENLYKDAHIVVKYEIEDSVIHDLMASDSNRFGIVSRKLSKDEEDYFHKLTYYPEQLKIAVDAPALIVNNGNCDTLLSMDVVKAIFSGQDSTWEQVDEKSKWGKKGQNKLGKIAIVFDHEKSGNSRYIKDSLVMSGKLPSYCYSVNGNAEVINYVSKTPNAMGVISVNWISDGYDSTVMKFLSRVKVVALAKKESENINDYYQPYPAYEKDGEYMLDRNVYVIKREARAGLGSGLLQFIASEQGQRIVYRAGLLPATIQTQTIHY